MDALRRTLARTALALSLCGAAAPVVADPALWRVSDGDSSVWLFGSIHVLPDASLEWRTAALDDLVANADVVVFEVLLDDAGMAVLGGLAIERGFLPPGQVLGDLLTKDENKQLDIGLGKLGLDRSQVSAMQPWLAAVTISSTALARSGGGQIKDGVDALLQAEIADGRERGLETAEMQLDLLSSGTSEEQIAGLMKAVDEIDRADSEFQALIAGWLTGDDAAIHAVMTAAMGSIEDPGYTLIITDRNARWAEEVAAMLADNTEALIVVGVAHLVGPVGLPVLLREQGFTVERIDDTTDD